jgi:hypothetical protein
MQVLFYILNYDELWDILLLRALPPAGEAGWKRIQRRKTSCEEKSGTDKRR